MWHRIMTAAEARKQTQEQARKRRLRLIKLEKQDLYKRIQDAISRGRDNYRYNYMFTPDGELYPEVKEWLISLGYKIKSNKDEDEDEWIISW